MHLVASSVFLLLLVRWSVVQTQDGEVSAKAQSTDADAAGKYAQKPDVKIIQPYCDVHCQHSYYPRMFYLLNPWLKKCGVNVGGCHRYRCGMPNCPDCRKRCVPVYKWISHWCGPNSLHKVRVVEKCVCEITKPFPWILANDTAVRDDQP